MDEGAPPRWLDTPARRPLESQCSRAEVAQLVEHATENRGVNSSILFLGTFQRGSGSVVEHHLAKVRVASSNLVFRSQRAIRD